MHKSGGSISRGQEGRRCKMGGAPQAKSTRAYRKSGLKPGWIIMVEVYVGDPALIIVVVIAVNSSLIIIITI